MAVIFGAMGYIAMQGQDSVMTQDETPEFVVVLGAQVQGDEPSLTLKKRLDKTLEFMQEHPDRTVIVSGGQGPDEAHTEASVMARYLIEHGADASRIIEEDKASNTRENLLFSAKLAEAAGLDTSRADRYERFSYVPRQVYRADALHGAIRPSKRYLAVDPEGQLHAARGLRLCQGVLAGSARMRLTVQKQERSRYHDR